MSDDVNESMVNDFVESEVLIDDNGTELSSSPFESQQQEQQQNNNQQNNNANQAKNQNTGTNNQNQQQQSQPAADPFDSQFFVQEKNGNKTFDAAKALDFIQNRNGYQTSQSLNQIFQPQVAQTQAQQQAPIQQPVDNRQPWERELEEEQKLRESFLNPKMSWPNHFQKALELGYQGDSAIAYANEQVKNDAEMEFRKASYERRYKAEQEAKQRADEERQAQEIAPKSRINLAKVASEFGGMEKVNALLFGVQQPDGKLANGYGIETINMLFDMAHEGKQLPKDVNELQKVYEKWWTKFTSNENNLRYVVDRAKDNLQRQLFPSIVDHINSVKNQNGTRANMASQSPVSAINKGNPKGEPDAFDRWMYGPNAPDTI